MTEKITLNGIEYVPASEATMQCVADHPYKIGKFIFIRTVTMALTGIVKAVGEHEIVLTDAAWIADTGRFADFLKGAQPNEIEPFPDGETIVGRGGVIDAVHLDRKPLREQI